MPAPDLIRSGSRFSEKIMLKQNSFSASSQSPAAPGIALEYRRTHSVRLRRDPANPKLHAFNVDLDEDGVRAVLFVGEVGAIGVFPTLADLGLALAQSGLADQRDEGVVGIVLKDDRDPAGAAHLGHLARTSVGDEPDRPLVLAGIVHEPTHWPHIGEAVLRRGYQPAIAHALDRLGRTGKQAAHRDGIGLVFRS